MTTHSKYFRSLLLELATLTLALLSSSPAWADAKNYQGLLGSTTWVLASNGSKGSTSGTGVLVDVPRKLVVTNFHVVGEARTAVIFFPAMKDGKAIVERKHYITNSKTLGITGKVLAIDRKRDLALVELEKLPEGAEAVRMATTSPNPGDGVESIGNPGSDALWVYTSGTVRSVYKKQFRTGAGDHEFSVVETQSPINVGDSGGPVINAAGELVAIVQSFPTSARLVSYSVDVAEVKAFLASPWKAAPLPIANLLTAAELEYTQHSSGHYEVQLTEESQKQTVYIAKDIEYFDKADVRKVWSLAATLKQAPELETAINLLAQNSQTKLGSWNLERTSQGEYLVIFCAHLDATASSDALKSTLEYVGKVTSRLKKDFPARRSPVATTNDALADWLK